MTSTPYQAVILAAGRGSRIGPQTDEVPKALLPIGPRSLDDTTETTFLRRQVEVLHTLDVNDVVVVVGYLGDQIISELAAWAPWVRTVVNPTHDIGSSGSLHSFQYAARSGFGVLDGRRQVLMMDADIVYHREALRQLVVAPEANTLLVCGRTTGDEEEVLVYGTRAHPRFLGKGLTAALVAGEPLLGEATGIVKLAPADHALVRETMNWLLGDPEAPAGSARFLGYGPARRATEHEELTQRLMHYGRIDCVVLDEELPFMEVDSAGEYRELRERIYPDLLSREASS